MKNVDVIIVHYGDIANTQNAIERVEKYATHRNVIVINNNPEIDIEKEIEKKKSRIFINSGKNIGFAAGANLGIKQAMEDSADFVLLLNNDASIAHDIVNSLLQVFKRNKIIGIVGPVIKFKKSGKLYYDMGGTIDAHTGKAHHMNEEVRVASDPIQVQYISGCCMLIKKEVIDVIGGFDERFFLYYEDVDYCLRAYYAGFDTFIAPTSVITHKLSASIGHNSKKSIYHLVKSGKKFGKKYKKKYPLHKYFLMYQSLVFLFKSPHSARMIRKGWGK
jgi:GT2 family glycosyltransferase